MGFALGVKAWFIVKIATLPSFHTEICAVLSFDGSFLQGCIRPKKGPWTRELPIHYRQQYKEMVSPKP